MLPTTADEVVATFKSSKNINSAIKNFLKRETAANDQVVRFAKDFRSVASMGFTQQTQSFIERNFKNHELNFLLIARYAHGDAIGTICDSIVTHYGEKFNSTYEKNANGIDLKDKKTFTSIVKEVMTKIDAGLNEANLPITNCIKSAVLLSIFDEDVLSHEAFKSAIGI